MPRALAAGFEMHGGTRVVGLERSGGSWPLHSEDGGAADGFAAVLLAIPQPQALALLGDRAGAFPGLEAVRMRPGLTLLACFEAERGYAGPSDADRRDLAPPLGLAVRDGGKPGRAAGPLEGWVIHAADAVAEVRLEDDPAAVARDLLAAFREQTGTGPAAHLSGHRWRYARTARPLGRACLWDDAAGLGLAGDWCLGGTAGDAAASGRALAEAMLGGRRRA